MTKTELIERITEDLRIQHMRTTSKGELLAFLDSLAAVTTRALLANDSVPLPGIGKLSASQRAARSGRNPATGESIKIPARRVPHFSPSKMLKGAL
ncbi:HU family DNA-binding protein [Microvirgula aerodenitrificans]|uniref:HU family DNA-binding protein n=1 Tax=Microvirgula aerodenitrificans TaxID=57480 RepID=UPI00049003F1|nr:HU family DNA-binding protein [Microvirgula aerodenitrificans]